MNAPLHATGSLPNTSELQSQSTFDLLESLSNHGAQLTGVAASHSNHNSQLHSFSEASSEADFQQLRSASSHALNWHTVDDLSSSYLFNDYVQPFSERWHPPSSTNLKASGGHASDSLAPVGVNVKPNAATSGMTTRQQSWLKNIQDRGLRTTVRSELSDGLIDRQDMLTLFDNAEDNGGISKAEFKDLKKVVNSATKLNMPDYVQNLADKVVNGDFANRNYQGADLGNLAVGSSAAHLEQLVDKWFLGGDRPLAQSYWDGTTFTYQLAKKPLFENGISYADIKQGGTGDCYFLAALASTALQDADTISNMFIDNGDSTYTVRFYNRDGDADYVTVDSYLPVDQWGRRAYADYSNELWVALAEKAYAQLNESGWIGHSKQDKQGRDIRPDDDDTNSYLGISGGYTDEATEQITGQSMTYNWIDSRSFQAIATAFSAGSFVSFSSSSFTDSYIVANHAYALVDYDAIAQTFTLYNPWGFDGEGIDYDANPNDGELELSWQELYNNFDVWNMNAIA